MFRWHLKDMLDDRNLSQKDFAHMIETREATISGYCNGKIKYARIKTLFKMCQILDCQISDIIEYRPKKRK
jgi:putative transcriptional regulator